ncbi:MAG: FMN-binding protein [Ruminococcus sp.]|nr:FMN-binding protein [Ruminococcus sp.]MBQ1904191.1 FMN-binding protein [Ruminococcus sp.]
MKSKIMPPLVLTLICILVCGMLVIAHDAAHVDNKGVMTKDMKKGCSDIFGEGDYEMLTRKNGHDTEPVTFGEKHVDSVIADKENKNCLIEMTCDGYAKGGLHLLVGIDKEGKIAGLYFLSIGETPGLGAKVAQKDYTDKFKGLRAEDDIEKIDTMTAATYSSNGLKKACEEALDVYTLHKGEIFA